MPMLNDNEFFLINRVDIKLSDLSNFQLPPLTDSTLKQEKYAPHKVSLSFVSDNAVIGGHR